MTTLRYFVPALLLLGISCAAWTQRPGCETGHASLKATDRPLDLAITGPGFFQLLDNNRNEIIFTRFGHFTKNADGQLFISSSNIDRPLEPCITIPQDATKVIISGNGLVSVWQPGNPEPRHIGQVQLARFSDPAELIELGDNLYQQSSASGTPIVAFGGEAGMGLIRSGFLEESHCERPKPHEPLSLVANR